MLGICLLPGAGRGIVSLPANKKESVRVMFKYYCPQNHSICEDGFLEYKGTICVFYDTETETCALAENLKYSAKQIRAQARLHQPLNHLLRDIDMGGLE